MQMKNHEKVIKSHSTQLVRYDAMCRAIQSCEEYDEVKEIRDRAVALEVYAAQALNTEAERSARVIRIRAERRAGQMLQEGKKKGHIRKQGRPKKGSPGGTFSKSNITKKQSSKWQQLADVSEKKFEEAMASDAMPSTDEIINREKKPKPMTPESVGLEKSKVDDDSLWLCGRLTDFQDRKLLDRDHSDLLAGMTTTMRREVYRLAPLVSKWLKKFNKEQPNDKNPSLRTNNPFAVGI